MANEDRRRLFNAISEAGYDIGLYDEFDKRMNNAEDRKKFFQAVNEAGYDIGDQEEFERRISPSKYKLNIGGNEVPVSEREYMDFMKRNPSGKSKGMPSAENTIKNAYQTVDKSKQGANRLLNREQRIGLDLPKGAFGRINVGENRKVTPGVNRFNFDKGQMEPTYITETGNEYGNRGMADLEQNAVDDARRRELDPIGTELQDLYAEQDRLNKLLEARRQEIEQARNAESGMTSFLREAGRAAASGMLLDNTSPSLDLQNDRQYSDLMAAARQNKEAITTLEDQRNQRTNEFWHSLGTEISNGYNFSLGGKAKMDDWISEVEAQKHIDSINEKRAKGEQLTSDELTAEAVLKNKEWDREIQGRYGDDYGAWARAGKMGANSADFMLDFLLMGGAPANLAKGVMSAVVKGGEKYLGNLATKGFGRFMLKSLGATLGSMVAGAEITNTVQLGKTASDVAQSMLGDVYRDENGNYIFGHYEEDEDGNPKFVSGGNDFFSALAEAERTGISENGSEIMGTFLPGATNVLKQLGLSKIARGLTALKGKGWYQNYSKFLETAGFNGVVGEGLEEYGGMMLDAIMGGDEWKQLGEGRTHLDIWLGVATMSGILNAPKLIGTGVYAASQYQQYKHAVNKASIDAEATMNPQDWAVLRERIDGTDNENIADVTMSILDDNQLSDESKQAAMNYIKNLQNLRGFSLGSIIAGKEEGATNEVSQEMGNSYTEGYDTQDPNLRKQYNDDAIAAEQNLPKYGNEFAKMVSESENPVETLDYLMQNRDYYTDEQIAAAADYFQKQAMADGMMDAALDNVDLEVRRANNEVISNTHQETGKVINALHDGRPYYVVGGDVLIDPATGDIQLQGTGGAMVVKDAETGETSVMSPAELSVNYAITAENLITANETGLRQQLMQQAEDDINFGAPANEVYQLEDTVTLTDGEGNVIEGQIGMMPNSIDGAYVVYTSDGKALQLTADDMNRRIVAHNGMEVQRESQPVVKDNLTTEQTEQPIEQNQPAVEQNQANSEQNQPEAEQEEPQSALSRIPVKVDEKGNPFTNKKGKPILDWHKASTEDAAAALVETTGGNMLMARDTANDLYKQGQQKLEKIRKQQPKGDDPIEMAESRMEIQRQVEEQQAINKQWQDVNQLIQRQMREEQQRIEEDRKAALTAEQRAAEEAEKARIEEQRRQIDEERRRKKMEEEMANWNKPYAPLAKARKEMAGDPDAAAILNDVEPRSLEEWVSSLLTPKSMMWDDEEIGGRTVAGLQSELGLQKKDVERVGSLVAPSSKGGKPFGQVVHDIWEGLPEGMKNMYNDQDVRNTLIDMFNNIGNALEMRHLAEINRIQEARDMMAENQRRYEEAELEAWAEAMHLTPEERETYNEWMEQAPTEPEAEIINNIIADEQYRIDQREGRQPASRADVSGSTSSQEAVQQAAETADNGNNEERIAKEGQTAQSEQTAADNNVPGAESESVIPKPEVDEPRFKELRQNLVDAYTQLVTDEANYPDAAKKVSKAARQIQRYVDEGLDDYKEYEMGIEDYEGNDPEKLADQYITRVFQDRYADDDPDDLYIYHGLKPEMRKSFKFIDHKGKLFEANEHGICLNPNVIKMHKDKDVLTGWEISTALSERGWVGAPSAHYSTGGWSSGVSASWWDEFFATEEECQAYWAQRILDFFKKSDGKKDKKMAKYFPSLQDLIDKVKKEQPISAEAETWEDGTTYTAPSGKKFLFNKDGVCTNPNPLQVGGTTFDVTMATAYNGVGWVGSVIVDRSLNFAPYKDVNKADTPVFHTEEECRAYLAGKAIDELKESWEGKQETLLIKALRNMVGNAKSADTIANEEQSFIADLNKLISDYDTGENGYLTERDLIEQARSLYEDSLPKESPIMKRLDDAFAEYDDTQDAFYNENGQRDDDGSDAMIETLRDIVAAKPAKAEVPKKKRNPKYEDFSGLNQGVRLITPDGTIEIYSVDYDKLSVYDIDENGNRSVQTHKVDTVDIADGLKNGTIKPAEQIKPTKSLGKTSSQLEIAFEESKVDTNPSEAQKEAGNYQKGHISIDGLDITIENPKGSIRRGTDADGKPWEVTMNNTYGYIRGTEGTDGDHIDVFLSDNPTSGKVFVVDQVDPKTGKFDESKCMYGFADAAEATKAYLANYSKNWKGLGAISGVSREAFKEWINSSHRKTKPFREYAMVKAELAKTDKNLYNIITDSKNSIVDFDAEYKNNLAQGSTITFYAIRENKKTGEKEYLGRNVGPEATVNFVIREKDLQDNLNNGTYEKIEKLNLPQDVMTVVDEYNALLDEDYKLLDIKDNKEYNKKKEEIRPKVIEGMKKLQSKLRTLTDEQLVALNNAYKKDGGAIYRHTNDEILTRRIAQQMSELYDEGIKRQGNIHGKDSGKSVKLDDYVADVDKNKPALDGVYYDPDGYTVVTDGYVLLADKQAYDKNHKGELLTLGKDAGKKKEDAYPDWKGIVNSVSSDYKQGKINVEKLLDFIAGVESKLKEQWKQAKEAKETKMSFKDWSSYAEIFVKMPDGSIMTFRPQYLKLFAQGMKKIGANEIKYLNIYNNVQSQSKNGTALVMPLARFDSFSDDADNKRFYYDLSEGKAETKRKLNHNDIISDIDEIDVPLQQKTKKSYTDREGVYHEGLEEELEHIGNSIRNRVDAGMFTDNPNNTTDKVPENIPVEESPSVVEGDNKRNNENESGLRTLAKLRRRAALIRAELARRKQNESELRQKYNINERGDISLDDLARMFRDLNNDEAIGELFERVFNVLKKLNLSYRFTDKLPGGVNGRSYPFANTDFYEWDAQTRNIDNQQKARILLHEMIHNATEHILASSRKTPLLFTLSPKQYMAARRLNRIFEEVKKHNLKRKNGKDFYALDSVDEMVAELANPEFREALDSIVIDNRSLWQQIKDAIKQMIFGDAAVKGNNALQELDSALDDVLDSYGILNRIKYNAPSQIMNFWEEIEYNNKLIDDLENNLRNSKGNDIVEESDNDKTLIGVHNISEEKLKKALKQGGLANPSLAVFDTNKYNHTDYGEISLIPTSSLIDSRTGRNAGTFSGDAWTPTYPGVERFLTKKGDKHRMAIAKDIAEGNDDIERHIAGVINDWVEGNGDRMHWLFLKQRGMTPEILPQRTTHNHEEFEEVQKIFGEGTSTLPSYGRTPEQDKALLALMTKGYEEEVRKQASLIKDEAKREAVAQAMLKRKFDSLVDKDGNLYFAPADSYVYEVWRDEQKRKDPKPDWYATDNEASYRVAKEKLSEEYENWKEQLLSDEDIEERLFAGWTADGNKRYVANTVQNASRIMNKESETNAYGNGGLSASKAGLLKKLKSLSEIRKYRHLLKSGEEIEGRHKEMEDEWFDIIHQLSDMQKIDSNPFINIDIAEARLQEAMQKRDPIGYINKEYGYDIAKDSEFASQWMNFIDEAKQIPVKYFETKFKRPVGLNEFAIAVVPTTTSPEVVKGLKDAGLVVKTYERGSIGDENNQNRIQAVKDAVRSRNDILFQKVNQEVEKQTEADKELRDALIDTMRNAGIDVITDTEQGQEVLDMANGEATLSRDSTELVRAQKVEDKDELEKLNSEPTVKRYRAMQLIDGKLYPPMSAKVDGEMRQPTEIGVWEKAEERPDLAKNGKFTLNKGQKGQGNVPAAYNPYFHTSTSGLNDQFTSAYKRPELVVVEVEIPESELTSGYKAEGAKDAVGDTNWHSGPVNGMLPDDRKRTVTLSRYSKVNRIVSDSEVADAIAKQLEGTDIEVPYNVVTPQLRKALEDKGVKISATPSGNVTENINGNPIQASKFQKVYHGSGAEFDAFDHSHMYEGEGAQAFGYGTYVTEVPEISKGYANKAAKRRYSRINSGYNGKEIFYKGDKVDLQSINPTKMAYDLINSEGTVKKAIQLAERLQGYAEDPEMKQTWQETIDILKDSKKSDFKAREADLTGKRYIYEVEIPDDNGKNYLYYDKEPGKRLLSSIAKKLDNKGIEWKMWLPDYVKDAGTTSKLYWAIHNIGVQNKGNGGDIYDVLSNLLGGAKNASQFLNDIGFVGIKYPTNTLSGGNRDGSSNYVIFNEDDAKIADTIKFQKVYHGTGTEFDAFDHSHMGEGEGNQAYGWGTYVTEVEGIGKMYAQSIARAKYIVTHNGKEVDATPSLNKFDVERTVARKLIQFDNNVGRARVDLERAIAREENKLNDPKFSENWQQEAIHKEIELLNKYMDALTNGQWTVTYVPKQSLLYTVDIPDDNGSNYFDWTQTVPEERADKILSDVREKLLSDEEYGWNTEEAKKRLDKQLDDMKKMFGATFYGRMSVLLGNSVAGAEKKGKRMASEILHDNGYVGIEYPAQYVTGGREDNAKNYVIFDENDAKITDTVRLFKIKNGQAYGYTYKGKIYVDPGIATSETPIHEYGHLWAAMKRQTAPEEWKQIKETLMNDKAVEPFIANVRKYYPELTAEGREDDFYEEVLTQYSGKTGAEKLRKVADDIAKEKGGIFGKAEAVEALRRMKQILAKFWQGIANMMGWKYTNAEDIADSILADLLNGVNPTTPTTPRGPGEDTETDDSDQIKPQKVTSDIAQDIYNEEVSKGNLKFIEAWQDSMIGLKAIQDAIAAETGNVATGAEDAYHFENRMHGRAKNMTEQYDWRFYRPMLKTFNDFCNKHHLTQEQGMEYLVAKSGLERNVFYAFRNAMKKKVAEDLSAEREKLEKDYADGKFAEATYKQLRKDLEEKERTGVDDEMQKVKELLVYKRALEDYQKGDIDFTEYLRRIEKVINANTNGYYEEAARDFSGLTETFAKAQYDAAQEVKKEAQRAIDPREKRTLWSEYDAMMRDAYKEARQVAEDAVFGAESDISDTNKLWNAINAATKETLKTSYENGLIDRKGYDKVRDMFEFYIPLRGWDENKAADVYTYMGKDNVFSPAVKKTWGRTSKAENPLAYIGNIAVSTILSGHRNMLKQHFLNYVMNNPTNLVSISESWYENIGTEENPMWILRTADTAGKSADEIAQIVNDFNEEMQQKQAAGLAMPVKGRLRLDVNATKGQKSEHVVEVQRAGHTYQLYINGDPKAAQALNGTNSKAVSRISDTWAGKSLADLNRSMAMFFTSKNPAFVISNLSRDLNMAGASVSIKESPKYNAKFIANVGKVLTPRLAAGDFSREGIKAVVGKGKGVTGMVPKLMEKWKSGKLDESNDTERYFKEFMDEGGETGFVNMLSVDSFKEKMKKEIKEMNGSTLLGSGVKETSVGKALRLMGETFEFYNRCAEDATRFIVYMTSRQMGKTLEESIADAKDVTLNFNRKGTGDKGNAEIRDLFIFVNPAIQALANMYRMMKGHPLRFGGVTLGFVVGGIMVPMINKWLINMFGDDDDKEAYWNLPPWVRKNNLVMWIPFTDSFVTIPLAQEFRVFYGIGEMISSYILKHPHSNNGLEIIDSLADLVPINPMGNGGNLIVDFSFTGVQPIMQLAFNTDFTGKPIWKDNQGNKYDPAYTKAYVSTPKDMVKLSKTINNLTGGNEESQGWLESTAVGAYLNNPAVWNHLLQGYFGGMYNTISKTLDAATSLAQGEVPEMYRIPVANRFLNSPVERDNAGVLGEQYWDLINEHDKFMHDLRAWQKREANGDEEAKKYVNDLLESDEYKRVLIIDHYKKLIDVQRKGEKAAVESADRADIKNTISMLRDAMTDELLSIDGGKDPMEAARERFDSAKSFAEKNAIRQRIENILQRGKPKKEIKTRDEEVKKALDFIKNDEEDSHDVNDKYLMLANGSDVEQDAQLKALMKKVNNVINKYKKLTKENKLQEAANYREDNQQWFTAEKIISTANKQIESQKKMLGHGKDYDMPIMKMIRSRRKWILDNTKELQEAE